MGSQWPPNYQPPQGQGYDQYPQQYPQQPPQQYPHQPQQYPQYPQQYAQYPQQYAQQPQHYAQQQTQYYPPNPQAASPHPYIQQPPQQLYPQQVEQYPNQYPQVTNAAYAPPSQSQPNQQGCYNCGDASHWAQDCPEPKRETPAGAYSRPPFKRHKPNPPVVTKYAVPPHVQQNQGQPPYNYGAQYPTTNYPQYQGAPGPPTPMSAQSPSHQQWQQQPHPQQYQQVYPQQQQYAQPYQQAGYQQQQHPYMQNGPPTPATPYGPHYAQHSSPQPAQAHTASYLQNGQYQQQPASQAQSVTNASPASAVSQTVPYQQSYQQKQYPASAAAAAAEAASTRQGSRNSSVSMQSMSVTSKQQSVEPPEEQGEEDDLTNLDIPDIPVVIDGSFASLVDRPLPSNFIVADALEPFDPPQPENDGRCQSKYVILDASSTFHLRVKDTKHWEDMKNDPVFRPVPKSARVISLQRILSMYRPREQGGEQKQAELEEGEWSQHTDVQVDEGRDVMDRLEHSLGAGHSMEPPAAVSRKASWDHVARRKSSTYSRPDRSSEDANTSRGIDGPHWPHQNTMRPYPPPPAREESPVPSPERTPPVRSRTPSMYELNELYQQEHGAAPYTTTIDGAATVSRDSKKRPADALDPFEPPPPPPRLRKPASYDGAYEDPFSPNGHTNGDGVSTRHCDSNGRSLSNGHSTSPTQLRHDAANGRKKDQDEQALSEEDNTPKRRQADDTKTKLRKRQQPKVAAAYSRRW